MHTRIVDPGHPKEGGVVAVLTGKSTTVRPMLLLGHLDVVEVKREDSTRDPFTLVEQDGYFYARGTSDMKAMDATWVDALMGFKRSGYVPRRTIKLALTTRCDVSSLVIGKRIEDVTARAAIPSTSRD